MDPVDVLRLLVDPDRLAVAGALAAADGPVDGATLASRAGVPTRTALETVAALVGLGLAQRAGEDGFRLSREGWLALAARVAAPPPEPAAASIGHGMTAAERELIEPWFEGLRLRALPSHRATRSVVLERLALEFEAGRRYPETEVNSILGRFHDDWSTLRRALVDHGLLDRSGNQYWRSGGRVV